MAIQTNNSSDNPSTERARYLLNQNIELDEKRRKALQAKIPSDPNAWQRMRENFEAILLGDPVFSEQNGIECKLWQLHYSRIEELRAAIFRAAGSNPSRGGGHDRVAKIRSQFKAFLTEATGFYHDLMVKIRAKYGLPLDSFFYDDDMDGQISASSSEVVKKGLVSCHRCFIYLGDLARYKGVYGEGGDSKARDFATASSYYMQANSLYPASGNPHHQLAILASYSDDVLVSVYRYFRSLAVDSPFTTASENLVIVFEKNRQIYNQVARDLKGNSRGDTTEVLKLFSLGFVRLNGILFTCTSMETFGEVFSAVRTDFLKLLSSGPNEEYILGPDDAVCRVTFIRLIAILIFTIHNVNRETMNQSYAEIMQRSVLLQCAFTATFEFTGLILERCSQLKNPSSSYLLPGIMVFVEWLACHQDMAVGNNDQDEKQANARLFFWNNFIAFLNKILSIGGYTFVDENETIGLLALSEDFELRGFLPLLPAQAILNFSKKLSCGQDANMEKKVRVHRIITAGKALANVVRLAADKSVYFDKKIKKFIIGVEPRIITDVVEEEDDEVIVFKPPSVMATGVKKTPITRPLRPPGFDYSLRSKVVDEPVSSPSLKTEITEIPQVDAFQFPAVKTLIVNSPRMENPKSRQDFEFSEQMRLFREQGHQPHKGNQGLWMI